MKKNSILLIFFLIVLGACSITNNTRIRIEMPIHTELKLSDYQKIIITDFLLKNEIKNFNVNKELAEYFSTEINQESKTSTVVKDISIEKDEIFENSDFWKTLAPESEGTLYFSGIIEYTQETRKALIGKAKKQFEDPFPSPQKMATRKFYNLEMDIYLIDAKTGNTVYQRNFKESQSYTNPNQTGYFAFFDLMLKVKDKLFRQVLGGERIQERYLIRK